MAEQRPKAVVLVVEADTEPRLGHLDGEVEAIRAHLDGHPAYEVECIRAATLHSLAARLNGADLRERLCIVHFAGHANGEGLRLRAAADDAAGATAYMRGIAEILKPLPHLRLFFLNGCVTEGQALDLLRAGVPLVIATRRGVDDALAREVAVRFYQGLSQGNTIEGAFNYARGYTRAGSPTAMRDLGEDRPAPGPGPEECWDIFGPRHDRSWRLVEPFFRGEGQRWEPADALRPESPYLGLKSFTERERDRFFGRDPFVEELREAIEASPLILIVGASGSGKSSAVRAGLIPRWKACQAAAGPYAFVITPGDAPFARLHNEIVRVGELDRPEAAPIAAGGPPESIRDAFRALGRGAPWLLVVDQFEQVFTRTADAGVRDAFLDTLVALARPGPPDVRVAVVMRDDFFPHLRDYPALFQLTDRNLHRIARLGRDGLREAVERPAALHGVGFAPGLVDEIVEEVAGQPGDLPLLQYTLDALWRKDDIGRRLLRLAAYRELGGVRGALRDRFQSLYDEGDEAGRKVFRAVMLRLVAYKDESTGLRLVSRLAPEDEFRGAEAKLVRRLRDEERLLTSGGDPNPGVQLSHDKILEVWPAYRAWIDGAREVNSVRQRLSDSAKVWARRRLAKDPGASGELWQGSLLGRALEMHREGDFDELVGGLGPGELAFLRASHRRSRRLVRSLRAALGTTTVLAVVASWTAREREQQRALARVNEQKAITGQVNLQVRRGMAAVDSGYLWGAWVWFSEALATDAARHYPEAEHRTRVAAVRRRLPRLRRTWFADDSVKGLRVAPGGDSVLAVGDALTLFDLGTPAPGRELEDSRDFAWIVGFTEGVAKEPFAVMSGYDEARGDRTYRFVRWDPGTGRKTVQYGPSPRRIHDVSSGGDRLVVDASEDTLQVVGADGRDVSRPWKLADVTRARLSPDGSAVVVLAGGKYWHRGAAFDAEPTVLFEEKDIHKVRWDPGGRWFACATRDRVLIRRFVETPSETIELRPADTVSGASEIVDLDANPDGKHLLATVKQKDGNLASVVWDLGDDGRVSPESTIAHEAAVERWEFNPPHVQDVGAKAAASSGMGAGIINPFKRVAVFSPDGRKVAAFSDVDGFVRVWDWRSGRPATPALGRNGRSVPSFDFTPDGASLVTAPGDGTIRLWEVADPIGDVVPIRRDRRIDGLTFNPDGTRLAMLVDSGPAEIWDYQAGRRTASLAGHGSNARVIAFSPSGKLVATGGFDQAVRVFDASTGLPVAPPLAHESIIDGVVFHSDEKVLTFAGPSDGPGEVSVWELRSGRRIAGPLRHGPQFAGAAWDLAGKLIALRPARHWPYGITEEQRRERGRPILWDYAADARTPLPITTAAADWAGFLGEGLAWTYAEGRVEEFESRTGRPRSSRTIETPLHDLLAVSRDGTRLIVGGPSGQVQVVDRASGEPLTPQMDHDERTRVSRAQLSEDGAVLLTVSREKVRIWSTRTGDLLAPPFAYDVRVNDAVLHPSGSYFAVSTYPRSGGSSGDPGTIHTWAVACDPAPPDEIRLAAEVGSGHRIDGAGGFVPLAAEEFRRRWAEYEKTPAGADGPSPIVELWHRQEAGRGDPHGRRFHAAQLAARIGPRIEADPSDSAARHEQLDWLTRAGRLDEAIAATSAIIEREPGGAHAYLLRARLRRERGLSAEAVADYGAAVERSPSDRAPRRERGLYLGSLGQLASALDDLSATDRGPTDARDRPTWQSVRELYRVAYLAVLVRRPDVYRATCRKAAAAVARLKNPAGSPEHWNGLYFAARAALLDADPGLDRSALDLVTSTLERYEGGDDKKMARNARLFLAGFAARGPTPEDALMRLHALDFHPMDQLFAVLALARLGRKPEAAEELKAATRNIEAHFEFERKHGISRTREFFSEYWPDDTDVWLMLRQQAERASAP